MFWSRCKLWTFTVCLANKVQKLLRLTDRSGIGPNDATQWVLNVQPVIPITLNKDWNLITRTIIPIINQPSPAAGIPSAFGFGRYQPQPVPLAGEFRQTDLGRWADDDASRYSFFSRNKDEKTIFESIRGA
jgi:hypothetical protein